jgi:SAM-dependent methyltransferase
VFRAAAEFYDALYAFKDYPGEAAGVVALLEERGVSGGTLLDVGCGAGGHLAALAERFTVTGVDLDAQLLALARNKLPDVELVQADMVELELGRRFDAVVCLYGSVAYTRTVERMRRAVARLARHLAPRGAMLLEPWYGSAGECPRLQVRHVDCGSELKIARLSSTKVEGPFATVDVHYLVGRDGRVTHLQEQHELGIFSHADHVDAFQEAGLAALIVKDGLSPAQDLYVASFANV